MDGPSMTETWDERALRGVLRVNGAITSLALLAVFLPLGWMDEVHRVLGMGPAPRGPMFEYLARTVSFLYFVHGTICLLLASDVRRYGPVITWVGAIELVFAGLVVWIDAKAGMPGLWTAIEAPVIAVFSGTILALRLCAGDPGRR